MYARVLGAAFAVAALTPAMASAQQMASERSYFQQQIPAPDRAFELTIATGYTQGFGMLQQGVGLPDVARAGIAAEVGAGYRIDPRWAVNAAVQYQELQAERADSARGGTGTLAAQFHIDPNVRLDPWVELGTGYRLLWEPLPSPAPTVLTHGFQLARVRAGLDLRVSPEVALAPVVGADATLFLWQDALTSTAISDPRLSTFVFAGVQGRIDVGGGKVGTTVTTSAQPE